MDLIDEKYGLTIRFCNFFENGFQSILKFSSIFCSSNKCTHIKRYKLKKQSIGSILDSKGRIKQDKNFILINMELRVEFVEGVYYTNKV